MSGLKAEFGESDMDSFLDSCVVIFYIQPDNSNKSIKKRCFEYVSSNIKLSLISAYIVEEIKSYIRKRDVQFNEIIKKKENTNYKLGESKEAYILSKEDVAFAEKQYELIKNEDSSTLKKEFSEQIKIIRLNFDIFLKQIKEVLMEKEDVELARILREFIEDYADCKVLSNVLVCQAKRELFAFVTADRHLSPNIYQFTKEDLRFKDYKFPELRNLLY